MDLYIQAKAAEHLFNIIMGKSIKALLPFNPEKPAAEFKVGKYCEFQKVNPEDVGLSSKKLTEMLTKMEESESANVHSIVIIKDNKLVMDASFAPFRSDIWQVTHSASKTLTAMAIGILVTRGKLKAETKLTEIFENEMNIVSKLKLGKITVKHLLTMSSGLVANELMIVSEKDYLKAALDSSVSFEPGSKFQYNSINSYLLSCIVQKITGKTQLEFLKEELFSKLNIENVFWESCPMGRTKGGWGLYMLPSDLGKLGVFLLNGGKINGETVISESYLKEMLSHQISVNEKGEGYGYQTWMGKRENSFLFNGMLGQNVHCFPDLNTVVAVTGGCPHLFSDCKVNEIINEYFAEGKAFKDVSFSKKEVKAFKKKCDSLKNPLFSLKSRRKILFKSKLPKECGLINGKTFELENKLLHTEPFFSRLISNSYPEGIKKISFYTENNRFFIKITEGECENIIPLNFEKEEIADIVSNGAKYKVAVKAKFTRDEDERAVLKISLPFLEHSSGQIIKIFIESEKEIRIRTEEKPGREVIEEGFVTLSAMFSDKGSSNLIKKIDPQLVRNLSLSITQPESRGLLSEKE